MKIVNNDTGQGGESEGDVKPPPVPPDQQPEIVPVEEPPKPGQPGGEPPLIA
jgi:hypothetical protein